MITGIILTKNEDKNIREALSSLSFVDEVIVIDDYSTDDTVKIVKEHKSPKVKVFQRKLDNFSSQRNFALSQASGDYIFFLDADERVSKELSKEILTAVKETDVDSWQVKRDDYIWGRKLRFGETANVHLIRLARKGKGIWKGDVHEEWVTAGKRSKLKSPLIHFPHTSISEFLSEIDFYTDLRSRALFRSHSKANILEIFAYPTGKFVQNYFLRQGFRDGNAGFVMAALMSLHSFLVRGKLWQLARKK